MKKIVSIDDEPVMLTCLSRALESNGYELLVTSDPLEGLKWLKERDDVCLALLDVRMPQMNGFDIYREMRKTKNIPVLFVTAYSRSFTAESQDISKLWKDEFSDGLTDIIYKPFDFDTLIEKVEGLIGTASDLESQ